MNETRPVPLSGSALIQSVTTSTTMQDTAQVPSSFSQLPNGALIKGFVINRDAQNNPILRTNLGDVLVKTDVFLKTGSDVVMRVNHAAGLQIQSQAKIISVDGYTLQQLQQQQQLVQQQANQDMILQPSMSSRAPARGMPMASTQQGIQIGGVLLELSTIASNPRTLASILNLPGGQLSALPKGAILQFHVVSSDLNLQPATSPASHALATSSALHSPQAASKYQAYSRHAPNPLGNPVNPFAHPTSVSSTPITSATPHTTNPEPISAPPLTQTTPAASAEHQPVANTSRAAAIYQPSNRPGVISATVIGTQPNGETTVRTPIGTIRLFTAASPPLNSVLQLELTLPQFSSPADTTLHGSNLTASSYSSLMHGWSSMEEAYQFIQSHPDAAREFMARIPNTKSRLLNSVLFFVSALKSGNLSQWLGNPMHHALEEQEPDLATRLTRDFGTIRNASSADQPDQPWQMIPLPIIHEETLHHARLYVRQDNTSRHEKDSGGTRFVVDLTMSELGELQLDGLTRLHGTQLQFDLVVRSLNALPEWIQQDIRTIFKDAAELTHFKGELRFQPIPERFIRPLEENLASQRKDEGSIIA